MTGIRIVKFYSGHSYHIWSDSINRLCMRQYLLCIMDLNEINFCFLFSLYNIERNIVLDNYKVIKREVRMNKYTQKLREEIFDSVKNNMEEKNVEAIIERSVKMTLKYVDTQVSTHKFFKDD